MSEVFNEVTAMLAVAAYEALIAFVAFNIEPLKNEAVNAYEALIAFVAFDIEPLKNEAVNAYEALITVPLKYEAV